MLGILVQLLLSWFIIWLFQKGNLSVLGLFPTLKRLTDFLVYFFIAALLSSFGFFLKMQIAQQKWIFNPSINFNVVLQGIWYNIKSVLFEELIFRGILFYILIKKLGASKAIVISSIAFGIYHWFTYQVLGNPFQMVVVFLITGLMGVIYAKGYAKTFSLYIPIAIHLGWNLVQSVVFSNTNIGKYIFIEVLPRPNITISYFSYYVMELLPLVTTLILLWFLLNKKKQTLLV
jgi:uncharacterized protein